METTAHRQHMDIKSIYRNRFSATEKDREAVWKALVEHYFQKWVPENSAVVDLGAGYCTFINNVKAATRFALDLNPDTLLLAAPDVTVISQDVTRAWPLPDGTIDVIFTSNFFEHLPNKWDLLSCLEEARRVLRPGGLLLALGPNIRFCSDVYWDFYDHAIPLSDRSLTEALSLVGLHVVKVIDRFLPYTMVGRRPPSPVLAQIYLRLPFVWRFFGKQFFLVARKAPE